RSPMKTVTAHTLFLVKFPRQPVEIGVRRQSMMKCGVEDRDMRHGGKKAPHLANARDVYWIVHRREGIERLDLRKHLVGEDSSLSETFAAVDHAMGHHTHLSCP